MKKAFIILVFIPIALSTNAQLKLFSSGSIAFGGTTDPGGTKAKFYNEVVFDEKVTFNDGSNLFEEYSSGGGLKVLGTGGTLSMYPDNDFYKFNTSEDKFMFEDRVQFQDGISVTSGGSATFYSTTTFNSTVNMGQYGTVNTTNFYGDIRFLNANSTADFQCQMPSVFNNGLTAYSFLTIYGNFNNYSDINLKSDILNINEGSLGKVLTLQGVTYNFKSDSQYEMPRAGFIAQEVQKIFPDLVVEEKEGLAIKSLELLPYLVEAIKEQQAIIEDLQNQVYGLSGMPALKGTSVGITVGEGISNIESELFQNNPNPFSEITTIKYLLNKEVSQANIYVYNMIGKQLRNYELNIKNSGEIRIIGGELEAGMYMYSLITDGKVVSTKQMILSD